MKSKTNHMQSYAVKAVWATVVANAEVATNLLLPFAGRPISAEQSNS
jgi:hypothetical protein